MRTKSKLRISQVNKTQRRKELGIYGNTNLVLHHKDPNLKHEDYDRYIEWRPEDLIIMTASEHNTLHNLLDKEKYERVSQTLTGYKHTDEHNENIRKSKEGCKWYNNGVVSVFRKECPEGFWEGRIYHRK